MENDDNINDKYRQTEVRYTEHGFAVSRVDTPSFVEH